MSAPNLRTGGTLDPDLDVYVVRPADEKVFQLLLAGEYVAVLTSRQMGKSSLVNKAARDLAAHGWLAAIVDLTVLGSKSDGRVYYKELIEEISRKLPLAIAVAPRDDEITGSPRDLINFIERLSQAAGTSQVAIFLDEIDSTLKLPYTDDLFTSIRAIYNERQVSGKCRNVVFCLIGVVLPDELVKDKRTTPYNIGQNLELDDFNEDREDLGVLRAALSTNEEIADRLLKRILYWTGGQPYLTSKLIGSVRQRNFTQDADIDRHVATTYGNLDAAAAQDIHFRYILRFVEERWNKSGEALDLYERILRTSGERDRATTAHAELKLAGLVKRDPTGKLTVRNRIYEQLFDQEWINRSRPRQQLLIYRRAAIFGGLATVGVLAGSIAYRQISVVPQEEQLQARKILADLRVSLEVIDGITWARIFNRPEGGNKDDLDLALVQLAKLFPTGTGLGIDVSRHSSLPFNIETSLASLPNVAGLDLSRVGINSLSRIAEFPNLKILNIENASLGDFSPLNRLVHLQQLDLSGTSCSSLDAIRNIPQLSNLSISSTRVTTLAPLQTENLKYFYAISAPLSDIATLSKARQLVEAGLSSTRISSISPLADASNLQALFLVQTDVQDPEIIRHFSKLQKLSLNGLQTVRVDFLADLQALSELTLRKIPFGDASPLHNLRQLVRLDLSQTRVTALTYLQELTNIESLDLSGTSITTVEPLSRLIRMVTLSLRNTGVRTLEPLTGMTKLRNLNLMGCAINLNELKKFPSLENVALNPDQLAQLPKEFERLVRKERTSTEINNVFNRDFGFNLGTIARSYQGFPTWWSGPLD